jgi:hypothetical protein
MPIPRIASMRIESRQHGPAECLSPSLDEPPYLRRASVNRRTLYCCRVTVRCVPMDLDWRDAVSADGRPEASRMLLLTPPALPEHRRTTQLSAGSIWNWRSWWHGSLS